MKRLVFILFFLISSNLFSEEINVGLYDLYPACFMDKDSSVQGIYVDIINEIGKINNWQIKYHFATLNENLNKLRNQEIDLMPGLLINDARLTFLDFSTATLLSGWSSFNHNKKYKIQSIEDLADKRIGLVKNDANIEQFLSMFYKKRITPKVKYYDDFSQMLVEIRNDSVVGGIFRNLFYEWQDPQNTIIPSPIKFDIEESNFAVPKGKNAHILSTINLTISSWKDDNNSKYYEILDKWVNPQVDYFRYIVVSALILIFIAFTFFLFRIYKKRNG